MQPLSLSAIITATNAAVDTTGAGDKDTHATITAVSADSRQITPGCLFVALRGDTFDGHAFVAQALAQGAAYAVVEADCSLDAPPEKLLRVADTRQALLSIAGVYRDLFAIPVTAITGSVGKTTTKEMIACVCQSRYDTLKTEMNLNNEIGVAQMLLRLTPDHQAAVLEMGMDGPGQIAPISRAVSPTVAVVTNIGVSHLEAMGTKENTCREKLDIRAGMPDGGTLILNGDDPLLQNTDDPRLRVVFYSLENPACAFFAADIHEANGLTTFTICYSGHSYPAELPAIGRHNIGNALAAFAVGVTLGLAPADAAAALKNYQPAGMRQKIVVHNSLTIVEDCYNASPDSMKAALETLGHMPCTGRRIAVLSDMLELGSVAEESHTAVGTLVAGCGADALFCTGTMAQLYRQGALAAGMTEQQTFFFADKDTLAAALVQYAAAGDVLWFKASRSMRLEEVLQRLYAES